MKEKITIGNSFAYFAYRLVQNYSTTHEMMITLSSNFEKEDISDDEVSKHKCLMDQIVQSHVDKLNENVDTLDADLSQAATDLKSDWDTTSAYQVKNLANYASMKNIKKRSPR